MLAEPGSNAMRPRFQERGAPRWLRLIRISLIVLSPRAKIKLSMLSAARQQIRCWSRPPMRPTGDAPGPLAMMAEAPVRSEIEAVMTLKPDVDDLVPSEASPRQSVGDPAGMSSFPKVLRRRLDKFFADRKLSPKADRRMWVKIAA